MREITIEEFREFVNKSSWTFAKTMSSIPHYWVVKNRTNWDIFPAIVKFIHDNGKKYSFYGKIWICLDCDENYYWASQELRDYDLNTETIINRTAK